MDNKIIMIGGNDPEMAGAVLKALQKEAKDATIYELDSEEMQMITNNRMSKTASEEMKEYMENEENKQQAKVIATEFHKRWFEEFENKQYISLTEIKKATTFSWKKFNEIIATLDMFGYAAWFDENKKQIRIILSEEDILENKKRETQAMLDLAKGKLVELQGMVKLKKEKDKLETMKKRMELTV